MTISYQEHFNKCWPEEAVGYVKDGVFHPLENIAADKLHSFEVDPGFLVESPQVLLHSHCTGNEPQQDDPRSLSAADIAGQMRTAIEWGVCVTDGETCEEPLYWGNPEHRPALLGREFIFGLQDCFALMQDWFYEDRKVVVPNIARNPHWNDEGENHIAEQFEAYGFEKIALADMQRGDVLLYKVQSPVANHIGVYLGNNTVLSHWFGRLSCEESFNKWANFIAFPVRLKQ